MADDKDESNQTLLSGQFVLHTLISEFTAQVDRKVDALLSMHHRSSSSGATLTKDNLMKSLQRGEDSQFDQLLSSLGCVAEYCLPSLLETLFRWYEYQLPNQKKNDVVQEDKAHKSGSKSKSDGNQLNEDTRDKCREIAVEFVFCLVLIEVLRQIPIHPLPDSQIRYILTRAFRSFHLSSQQKFSDTVEIRIVADLYAEAIGVLAQTKFQAVRNKFMFELHKEKEPSTSSVISLIMGMKYFRVKMYPIEDFEASFRFLQELANYSLDIKNREVKHALAGLFVEVLVPVAAAVKTEVNVPVLRDFVDSLYPTSLELSKRQKNKLAMFPLITCLLCVSQKTFFLNNWHIFLDICLSTLRSRDQKLSRVALESLYRLLWVYMVRVKCESNTTTQMRLQSIVKNLFPPGSRNIIPKDTPLNIFVKIIQFIALERLNFAMKDIVLDLLSVSSSGSRATKPVTLYPERMNIGLRAFLIITDSLQQKDGAPPMPCTINVMPSGNTIRVKKTFINKTLTEEEARMIGVSIFHKQVQRALDGILLALDGQVGVRMMLTNSQLSNKDPQDLLQGEHKPKIELFRTCVAAIPRLMPHGMSDSDLLEMLCRLTVHVDEELRSRAITALQAFAVDFPHLSEEVVASFLSFVLKQVSDIHQVLLDGALKMLASLIISWKNNVTITESGNGKPQGKQSNQKTGNSTLRSHSSPTSGRCIFAPIINRIEGFAIVMLFSSRSIIRKLACHILKEVRTLARALDYGKRDEPLCLDVFDSLCPEVAEEVLNSQTGQKEFKHLDKNAVIAVAYEKEFSALVECSSSWHEVDGLHPWIYFMTSFVEVSRLPKICATAMSYSWPDVYIRLTQIQRHLDHLMTTGSKKVATVSISGDQNLILWTNYLIFACKSAPSSSFIKQKQSTEAAVPAGTPDWQVTLTRDVERIDAVPSTLFQRLVSILRAENSPAYRESAVLGLGYTSVAAFQDLLTEILHLIHEASETKKQENVRRRRKRDNIRVVLVKLFSNLASHKVLSQGILTVLEKPSAIQKQPKEIVQEYIEETRSILETMEKSENILGTSFSAQPLNSSTPFGSQTLTTTSAANMKDEIRFCFAEMLVQLVRHLPLELRSLALSKDTRKKLFFLFSSWCDKFASAQQDGDTQKNSHPSPQLFSMLCAECSVLCCGPVFDDKGLEKDGYIYQWLESLLNCSDPRTQQLGQETIILLLHFNADLPYLLAWLIDKCYTGPSLVATSCFMGISTVIASTDYECDAVSIIMLAMFKTLNSNAEVSQIAENLLSHLLARFFPIHESNKKTELPSRTNSMCGRGRTASSHSLGLHSITSMKTTEDLARLHPEITHGVISELFLRFPTATLVGQRSLLKVLLPWLQNVELVLIEGIDDVPSAVESHRRNVQDHPWLPHEGWGSENASLHVLNNLTYLTTFYHQHLDQELENCWAVLCNTWYGNLICSIRYLMALYSIHTTEPLKKAARLAMTYLGRAKGARVTTILVDECKIAEPISVTLEMYEKAPYYKVVNLHPKLDTSKDSTLKKGNSPSIRKHSLSEGDYSAIVSEKEPLSSVDHVGKRTSSPVGVDRKSKRSDVPFHHRFSLQVSPNADKKLSNDKPSLENLSPSQPVKIRPVSGLSKRSPVLSSSLCSLNTNLDGPPFANATSSPKFTTVSLSAGRSADVFKKPTGSDILNSKLPQKFTSAKELRSKSLLDKSDTNAKISQTHSIETANKNRTSQSQIQKFLDWAATLDDDLFPKPLPLSGNPVLLALNTMFQCQRIDGLMRSNIACIFLSELAFYRSIEIQWQVHLPSVLLSLILNLDQNQLPEVPFYCRRLIAHLLVHLLPDFVPAQTIGTVLSYSQDSCSHMLSPKPICVSVQPISKVPDREKNNRYSYAEISAISEVGETDQISTEVPIGNKLKNSCAAILVQLINGTDPLWLCEDASPKNIYIRSANELELFIQIMIELLDHETPRLRIRERLGSEASNFAVTTKNKHLACRSLQIFRALNLPLTPVFFNKLVSCLLKRIMYGSDTETQSQVIEILVTLLHDCDISTLDKRHGTRQSFPMDQSEQQNSLLPPIQAKKPRSPTPGRIPNFPTSSVKSGTAPLSLPSQPAIEPGQPDAPKRGRKGHAHRRSGSVTLSKKMANDLVQSSGVSASTAVFHTPSPSVAETAPPQIESPKQKKEVSRPKSHSVNTGTMDKSFSPPGSFRRPASTGPDFAAASNINSSLGQSKVRVASKERRMTFAQIFWIGVALLESDYEHEFVIAVQLIEKVLTHLPLTCVAGRSLIERYISQINWTNYPGVQNLLLKGLTSSVTYGPTFRLLASFTTLSDISLVSGDSEKGEGFSMNVVALLPHLLDCFTDPDQNCLDAAQNIAQVCVDSYEDKKKLQSLAHVMSLYSNRSYGKPCMTWISVVCKYIHETFPDSIREHLTFLIEMLDKGPISTHMSCLRIVYSLLSLSEVLVSHSPGEINFTQNILKTVSKFVNNTKLWKEALNILKLAVSRCSAITTPTASGMLPTSSSLGGDMDRIALPGRTLTFQYDLANTPIVGRRRVDEGIGVKQPHSSSPSYHPSTASSVIASWKRPHLSQKRMYDNLSCVYPICGKHIQMSSVLTDDYNSNLSPVHHEEIAENEELLSYDSKNEESGSEEGTEEDGSVVDDVNVFRNFDFLDEFENEPDAFAVFPNQPVPTAQDNEVSIADDDPDTYNLTPIAHRETSQELDQTPPDDDEDAVSEHSNEETESISKSIGLSRSWSGTPNTLTDPEIIGTHSSMIIISSIESENTKSDEKEGAPKSSEESLSLTDSPHLSHSRFTQSESAINQELVISLSSESMKQQETTKSNELNNNDENTSESLSNSNLDDSENGFSNSSPISSTEELQNKSEKSVVDDISLSLTNLGTPPPPSIEDIPGQTDDIADIPIVEPPPTSDITSNLSAVRFDSPSHFLHISDSPAKTLPPKLSTSFKMSTKDKTKVCHDTTYTTWRLHIASMATYNDAEFISKTFDLFPVLFKVLCVDFSDLSKEGCKHLDGQLSKIAEYFSSMVEQLPSQIKCPTCLATKSAIEPVVEQMKFGVLELQEQLDSYNEKQKSAMEYVEHIKNLKNDDASVTKSSQGIEYKQLELCRALYKHHFQLLLLLKSFNKLIHLVEVSSVDTKNISEQLGMLKKKIMVVEKTFQAHRDKTDTDMLRELESMTVEEAEQLLMSSISSEHVHLALRQLSLLREMWRPEIFGASDHSAADYLVKIYFKHLEEKSQEKFYAILGPEDSSHERLMEVNIQIQQSLDSLVVNAGDIDKNSTTTKKTHF